jgi:hypothetical protein
MQCMCSFGSTHIQSPSRSCLLSLAYGAKCRNFCTVVFKCCGVPPLGISLLPRCPPHWFPFGLVGGRCLQEGSELSDAKAVVAVGSGTHGPKSSNRYPLCVAALVCGMVWLTWRPRRCSCVCCGMLWLTWRPRRWLVNSRKWLGACGHMHGQVQHLPMGTWAGVEPAPWWRIRGSAAQQCGGREQASCAILLDALQAGAGGGTGTQRCFCLQVCPLAKGWVLQRVHEEQPHVIPVAYCSATLKWLPWGIGPCTVRSRQPGNLCRFCGLLWQVGCL